jgi:hypothetical protein
MASAHPLPRALVGQNGTARGSAEGENQGSMLWFLTIKLATLAFSL